MKHIIALTFAVSGGIGLFGAIIAINSWKYQMKFDLAYNSSVENLFYYAVILSIIGAGMLVANYRYYPDNKPAVEPNLQ